MRKLLFILMLITLAPQTIYSQNYISPIKNLEIEFNVDIDNSEYKDFELNIIIPNTEYIKFGDIQSLTLNDENIDYEFVDSKIKVNIPNGNSQNKFNLNLETDYNIPLDEYKTVVENNNTLIVDFEFIAKQQKSILIDENNNIVEAWNNINQKIENNLKPIELKFINIPDIK